MDQIGYLIVWEQAISHSSMEEENRNASIPCPNLRPSRALGNLRETCLTKTAK